MSFRASSKQQFYVSVSRGKHAVSIYTDDKTELLQAVSQSAERKSATELLRKRQIEKEVIEKNRKGFLKRMKEKAMLAVEKISTFSKTQKVNNGLPGKDQAKDRAKER